MEMAKSFFGRDHEGYVGKKDHAVCDKLTFNMQLNTHSIGNLLIFTCFHVCNHIADNRNSWIRR